MFGKDKVEKGRSRISASSLLFLLAPFFHAVAGNPTCGVDIQFKVLPQAVIEQRLKLAPDKNAARESELQSLFREAGCPETQLTEQVVRRKGPPNLTCNLPGTSDATIVVGAHFDHVKTGRGVVDDWSGAALLPSLLQTLKRAPHKHTYVFAGFTDEEKQLAGSDYYVRHLGAERISRIRAMINLECLGLTPTKVWMHHADRQLLLGLLSVAKEMNLPIEGVNVEKVGDDDADSFRHRHVPTITIHSVTQNTWPILHSARDDFAAINVREYYNSYRLIAAYLTYLDSALD